VVEWRKQREGVKDHEFYEAQNAQASFTGQVTVGAIKQGNQGKGIKTIDQKSHSLAVIPLLSRRYLFWGQDETCPFFIPLPPFLCNWPKP
jgi:hypothetical protein